SESTARANGTCTNWGRERHKHLCNLTFTIDQTKGLHYVSNLAVDRRVEDSVARADHCLVIANGIPGNREAWSNIVFVCWQCAVLTIHLIADTRVQVEVRSHGPGIREVDLTVWTRIVVHGIAKTLLIELWQTEGERLQRVNCGSGGHKSAVIRCCRGRDETWAQDTPRQVTENKPAREKSV